MITIFIVGIFVASFVAMNFVASWPIIIFLVFLLIASAYVNFLLKNKYLVLVSFSLIFFIFGLSYASFFDWRQISNMPLNQEVVIVGQIVQKPEITVDKQKFIVKINDFSPDCTSCKGRRVRVTTSIFPTYSYGQTIKLTGQILPPERTDTFDTLGYAKRFLVTGFLANPTEINVVENKLSFGQKLLKYLYDFSTFFETRLNQVLPEPHASLASGIILGIKRNIPDNFMTALQNTGLTHIIALSGFNVTILAVVFANLLLAIFTRRTTFIIGSSLVIIFVLMTGCAASVVRAAIFSLVILFGETFGRRADQYNIIILAAFSMLLFNPNLLRYDLGFQLSFLAFLGLVYLAPLFLILMSRLHWLRPTGMIPKLLAETLGAQAAVTPIILYQFGKLSLISPIANLLVVWIVPLVMALTFAVGFLSIIYLPLGYLASFLLWPSLEYIIQVVNLLSALPYSALTF
ncbi:MAG: ComEC/Rec2 family competence protein [bacterium]